MNPYEIPLRRIDGSEGTLSDYRDRVLLVVNVASQCGLTPQYEGLQRLHERYCDRGLTVLGFPANDFANQEPGDDAEIEAFCSNSYGVDFPVFGKIVVKGPAQHPLYAHLTDASPERTDKPGSGFRSKLEGYGFAPACESDVLWNFEKFLLDRTGRIVGRFAPDVEPEHPLIVEAIERELNQQGTS